MFFGRYVIFFVHFHEIDCKSKLRYIIIIIQIKHLFCKTIILAWYMILCQKVYVVISNIKDFKTCLIAFFCCSSLPYIAILTLNVNFI